MNMKPSGAFFPGVAPPQRVDLGDIVARRRQPNNLIARFEAVTMSYPALHPWMEWASEPITLDRQRAYGETMAVSRPDPDGSCACGIFDTGGAVLGAIGMALPGVDRVEIHSDKANVRSAAVPRRLGYRLDRVEPRPVSAPAESGLLMVWTKSSTAEGAR
jgi:hypothetical protein